MLVRHGGSLCFRSPRFRQTFPPASVSVSDESQLVDEVRLTSHSWDHADASAVTSETNFGC